MNPRRHPSPDLIERYARGELSFAPSLPIGAHIETCALCRAQTARLEHEEGNKLAGETPVEMAADALDRVLTRLEDEPDTVVEPADKLGDTPLPQSVAQAGLGSRRWLGSGFWAAPVRTSRREDWRAFLLRVPPGARIPTHGHQGGELIAVLQGGFHDGSSYGEGDFAQNIAHSTHHLTIDAKGPCACLIAVQGRLQWRGWAKLISPLLGI